MPSARVLSPAELRRARFRATGAASPTARDAADAVGSLGAAQGQDLPGALLSIALRIPGGTVDDVRASFARGDLVRTWTMRGTLHVATPDDADALVSLTGERTRRSLVRPLERRGLTPETLTDAEARVAAALSGSGPLTRAAFGSLVERAGVDLGGAGRLSLVAHWYAAGGILRFGPFDGTEQLIEGSTPRVLTEDEADAALTRILARYVAGHGPVSERDAVRWTALPLSLIRRSLNAVPGIRRVPVGDEELLTVEDDVPAASRGVRLLPGFDEFLLGYADRGFAVPAAHAERVVPGGNGMFLPTVVTDGRVVGVWSRRTTRAGLRIDVRPFGALAPSVMRGLGGAAERVASALALPLDAVAVS